MTDFSSLKGKRAFARERLTIGSVTSLTASIYNQTAALASTTQRATYALIQVVTEEGEIQWTVTGDAPSATVGFVARGPDDLGAKDGAFIVLDSQAEIANFQANGTATDIEVVYFMY